MSLANMGLCFIRFLFGSDNNYIVNMSYQEQEAAYSESLVCWAAYPEGYESDYRIVCFIKVHSFCLRVSTRN